MTAGNFQDIDVFIRSLEPRHARVRNFYAKDGLGLPWEKRIPFKRARAARNISIKNRRQFPISDTESNIFTCLLSDFCARHTAYTIRTRTLLALCRMYSSCRLANNLNITSLRSLTILYLSYELIQCCFTNILRDAVIRIPCEQNCVHVLFRRILEFDDFNSFSRHEMLEFY